MSSPIHYGKDLDPALMYAPRPVRDRAEGAPGERFAPAVECFEKSRHLADSPAFAGGPSNLALLRKRSLDPEIVPEPPQPIEDDRAVGRIALRISGVVMFAAAVATAVVLVPAKPRGHQMVQAGLSTIPTSTNSGKQDALAKGQRSAHPDTQMREVEQPVQVDVQRSAASATPAANAVAKAPSSPTTEEPMRASPSTPDLITRRLEAEQVTSLLKRGRDFLASGDVASARLVLRRAAEAGDREAALALAGTFDPGQLQKLDIQGLADVAAARLWYERAEQFGSAEAPQRLQQLATQVDSFH